MNLASGETAVGVFSPFFLSMGHHRFDFVLETLIPIFVVFLIIIGIIVWAFWELASYGTLM